MRRPADSQSAIKPKAHRRKKAKSKANLVSESPEDFAAELPSPSRPNFIRRNAQSNNPLMVSKWHTYLELKKLSDSRTRVCLGVYFRRWRLQYANSHMRTVQWETGGLPSKSRSRYEMDTNELIELARAKANELAQMSRTTTEPRLSRSASGQLSTSSIPNHGPKQLCHSGAQTDDRSMEEEWEFESSSDSDRLAAPQMADRKSVV
jgi:hypothetical protein